jgi:hypothetical protein
VKIPFTASCPGAAKITCRTFDLPFKNCYFAMKWRGVFYTTVLLENVAHG